MSITLGTKSQYAAHRKKLGLPGASPPAVTYAVQAKRIFPEDNGDIYFEKADLDWAKNTNPASQAVGVRSGILKVERMRTQDPAWKPPTPSHKIPRDLTPPPEEEPPLPSRSDFNQSKSVREYYEAKLSQLKFEEKEGTLIPARVVKKVLYEAGRIVRSGHDEIVAQLAPACASETSIDLVERLLKKALDDLDNRLADKIEALDADLLSESTDEKD